jgi:uncharacterized protein YfkK (UPF0435 family)
MNNSVLIDTALRLPAPDIEALIEGRMIAAMPRIFINPGRQFALCPSNTSINTLPIEQYYRSSFLPIAQKTLAELGSETVSIKAWAQCELCQVLNEAESFGILSQLTVWTEEALQQTLSQAGQIFLTYLRVYRLPQPFEMPVHPNPRFIPLPQPLTVTEATSVLSDRLFTQCRRQLEKLEPPLHPELEELQSAIAQLNNPSAQQLAGKISQFLGWTSQTPAQLADPKLDWIKDIVVLGDRSKELDEKKSNYQAGTDFENIVRQSLEFLGFTVDEAYKGGAGGLDLFCSKPYPLVGECKAGKGIPSRSAEELIKLGGMRLDEAQFQAAAKLIIGPGKPSTDVLTASQKFKISIINPMALQKLVELQAKYPGSVNLITLKEYLEPGQIDSRIDDYIQKVETEIKLRSHLVELVKNYLENTRFDKASVHALHGVYAFSRPSHRLSPQEMHEILVELSSPLTGYLGRIKGDDWGRDRFYFLRDLKVD